MLDLIDRNSIAILKITITIIIIIIITNEQQAGQSKSIQT